ncbi:TRAP transporter substrate-binding protein, partial [Martelella sp. FOR1707]
MKIRLSRTGITIAAGLLTGMALTTGALAQEVILKLSYNQPETSASWQQVYEVYAEDLETLSDNRIKVERYPNSVLHSVGDGFKALVSGITDITAAYPIYTASSFNLIHANELPHALPDDDYAAVRLVSELYPDYYRDEYERMGVYLAFAGVNGSYDIMTKTPVNSLDDLKGLKLRGGGGGGGPGGGVLSPPLGPRGWVVVL